MKTPVRVDSDYVHDRHGPEPWYAVRDKEGFVVALCYDEEAANAIRDALNFAAEWTETVMPMTDTDEEFELVKRLDAALNGGRDA